MSTNKTKDVRGSVTAIFPDPLVTGSVVTLDALPLVTPDVAVAEIIGELSAEIAQKATAAHKLDPPLDTNAVKMTVLPGHFSTCLLCTSTHSISDINLQKPLSSVHIPVVAILKAGDDDQQRLCAGVHPAGQISELATASTKGQSAQPKGIAYLVYCFCSYDLCRQKRKKKQQCSSLTHNNVGNDAKPPRGDQGAPSCQQEA